MALEAGADYECEVCGGTHTVERGKGLDVAGFGRGIEGTLYVRCPKAGYVALGDGRETQDGAEDSADDWP